MLLRAGRVFEISRRHDRVVRQQLDAGISAVPHFRRVAVQELHTILAGLGLLDVVIRPDPRDEVAFRRAVPRLVAEGDHQPTVFRAGAVVAIARQSPRCVHRLAPRRAFVAAEHHQTALLVGVLAQQAAKLRAIRRPKNKGLARILSLHRSDDLRRRPGESAIRSDHLQHFQRCPIRAVRAFVIEAEIASILQPHDAAESHHALVAERRPFLPRLAAILAHDAGHSRAGACAFGGGENPQPLFPRRVHHAVNARAVLMRRETFRQRFIHARPCLPSVITARHRASRTAVVDAPHREDRLPVRHQQRGRMALIGLLRARGHDDVPLLLLRDVHERQIRRIRSVQRCD